MNPPLHPAYRGRYLPALTREQIDALPDKATAIVILPTGAIEQHGSHLTLGVDAILGQALLEAALAKVPASVGVYVGPAITYGKSNEHADFPGTVSISGRTLHRLLKTAARHVHALGFRTLAVLNTHGGNTAVLVPTLREIQTEFGLNAGMLGWNAKPAVSAHETRWGFHAGQWETSLMLAIAPHLVQMDLAVCEYPVPIGATGRLQPENAPATFSWLAADLSHSGVMGDATKATVADGATWLAAAGAVVATQLEALAKKLARSRGKGRSKRG